MGWNSGSEKDYNQGFAIQELFHLHSRGVITSGNNILASESKKRLVELVQSDDHITPDPTKIRIVSYRPFDEKYIYCDINPARGNKEEISGIESEKDALGIDLSRRFAEGEYSHILIADKIVDVSYVSNESGERNYFFPLYIYADNSGQMNPGSRRVESPRRTPNFNTEIVHKISNRIGLLFIPEEETGNVCFATNNDEMRDDFKQVFTPTDLLDYIYAVLYSPAYRKKYRELLMTDFPRVPYPQDDDTFWKLVNIGSTLRQLHLLECPAVEHFITRYPEEGGSEVTKPVYKNGNVYINSRQYFTHVPEIAWDFYIGGYRPAQKWLNDRKGGILSPEDIQHYQKIIVAITETDRLMKEADKVLKLNL